MYKNFYLLNTIISLQLHINNNPATPAATRGPWHDPLETRGLCIHIIYSSS
jgi:hypothetical protein